MKNTKISQFTNLFKISKTIKNELIPQGKTSYWIKKHNIIGNENNNLTGKDAIRANNYKYCKKMFDEMHRQFIQDCLSSISEEQKDKLDEIIIKISTDNSLDNQRKELSKLFKFIFDEQANRWIFNYSQEMPIYWQEDIGELEQQISGSKDIKEKKYLTRIIKALEKKIRDPKIKQTGIKAIHSNTSAFQLLEWRVRSNLIQISGQDIGINESKEPLPIKLLKIILRSFDGFHTYFSGFNDNRENIYNIDPDNYISTSIIYRIFEQNLFFFINNLKNWATIQKSLKKYTNQFIEGNYDWQTELNEIETLLDFSVVKILSINAFTNYFAQSGIDRINQIIGGIPANAGKEKIKGLNEWINLTRQQVNAKRNEFPPLQKLFKQILSKGQGWFIESFKDDEEMLHAVKDFQQTYFHATDENNQTFQQKFMNELQEVVTGALTETENIYIKKDKLNSISHQLTGSWHSINDWIASQANTKELNALKKQKHITLNQLDIYLASNIEGESFYTAKVKDEYQSSDNSLLKFFTKAVQSKLTEIEQAWQKLHASNVLELNSLNKRKDKPEQKGFKQVAHIKEFLDCCNNLNYFLKDWTLKKQATDSYEDWYNFINSFLNDFKIYDLYNKVRNHIAKKPFSTEKVKVNFEKSTLLDGWDRNKEVQNLGILFEKNKQYYLGIMTPDSNKVFDYEFADKDSANKKIAKESIRKLCLATSQEDTYRKINYKLLPGANKMLPKVFFAKSNKELFNPSAEIIYIKQNKLYSKAEIEKHGIGNLHKYIDFCIDSLAKHPEWSKAYSFSKSSFKKPTQYTSIDVFYKDVEDQGYKITFDNIKKSYIDEKVENGELYLFKIHNKDFSRYSKGNKNLHTLYWRGVFENENLKDTVIKLNGEAEIFYRKASLKLDETTVHKAGERLKNKNKDNPKKQSKFAYDIIKDRRYTQDKFFFHCPITLNAKSASIPGKFNDKINKFLQNNKDVNIIGIDRGEKHLLYYSVIDQSGNIVPNGQGSFNKINGVDYLAKLKEKEVSRDEARKSWTIIENVKELKAGYLSHVIHKLAELIIKHNAIVVLEDLNIGFKRGRFKVERQVYQKFEKALIDKLNYLVFKKVENRLQAGHYLNAYQLTNKFDSFQKLGKQCGILFYTTAAYTSITDPVTGFMKNVYKSYKSVSDSQDFWQAFESIDYNSKLDRFEFTYDTNKVTSKNIATIDDDTDERKTKWTVCSSVIRSKYSKNKDGIGENKLFNVNEKLKILFDNEQIDYRNNNVKTLLIQNSNKSLHKNCLYYFNAILNLRVTDASKESGTSENDFILSPVEPFFDSRKNLKLLPENGDANGAYNIARKGICILNKINQWDGESKLDLLVKKIDWQEYCQDKNIVLSQTKKL